MNIKTDFGQHIFDMETIIIKHTKLYNFKIFISSLNVLSHILKAFTQEPDHESSL